MKLTSVSYVVLRPVGFAAFVMSILYLISFISEIRAFEVSYDVTFPRAMTLRAAILTKTVPLAYFVGPRLTKDSSLPPNESLAEYRGFQPDLLRQLQIIARNLDNVTLEFDLEEVPPFSYTRQFQHLANNCNTTENPLHLEDCQKYDLVVGDFYAYPSRSIQALLSPPLLGTAAATAQYIYREKRQIATLEEARALQEPVCLLKASHYDDQVLERFPGIQYIWCYNHTQCIEELKREACALFVEDELQLRFLSTQDAELEVTREHFDDQYIVWPMNARLDPLKQHLLIRWIYEAKVSGFLDELYKTYFSINYCPLGKAGQNCDLPCSPSRGLADRHGKCICESIRWTGEDCSIEVQEDKHLIPQGLHVVCYIMIAINYTMVAVCGIWMWIYRGTVQVSVAQPLFLGLVLAGCLVSTSVIFALGVEDDDGNPAVSACMAIPWLYSVGFSITFGTLLAKIRRVYLLFKAAAHMERATVSAKETMSIMGGILLVDVSVLTTWTLVDPLEWNRTILIMDHYGHPLSSEGYCTSEHWEAFAGTIAALHLTLMAVASYLCYVSRNVPTDFSEGKYVMIAFLSNLQIFIVGVPVMIIVGSSSESSYFVRSIIVWMNDFVVVTLIFGNLMYHVHWSRCRSSETSSSRASFIRHAMATYVASSKPRVNEPEANPPPHDGIVAGRFSTYDGITQRPAPLISEPIEESTEGTEHHEDDVERDVRVAPIAPTTVSESEARLQIDVGNGQTCTVPIIQVKFDSTCVAGKL